MHIPLLKNLIKMNAKQILNNYKEKIDKELRFFFDKKIKKSYLISESSKEIMETLKEFNLRGGKRIRPVLTIFGYKALGGKEEKEIIRVAMAVELMEAFLLIHDDIMDQDEFRRGYLTVHKIYENRCKNQFTNTDYKRFGESMAIIAGDILAMLGIEVILSSKFSDKLKLRAINKFYRVVINTCFGQTLDLRCELEKNISEEDILRIQELKTSIYTIEGPLHIGAILAGATKNNLRLLSGYAIPLGKAFQIQDDILGMFGNEKKLGKPVGSDLREGKKTLLILKALEKSKKGQRQTILNSLGNKDLTISEIDKIRKIIIKTGALDHSKNLAKQLSIKAKNIILKSKLKKEGKDFLIAIADYMVNREV
jgi:geranylgeranyl diphosphate synthase type I